METNEHENLTVQNLCDAEKAILRGKYITILVFLKELENFQTHKLTLQANLLKGGGERTANIS